MQGIFTQNIKELNQALDKEREKLTDSGRKIEQKLEHWNVKFRSEDHFITPIKQLPANKNDLTAETEISMIHDRSRNSISPEHKIGENLKLNEVNREFGIDNQILKIQEIARTRDKENEKIVLEFETDFYEHEEIEEKLYKLTEQKIKVMEKEFQDIYHTMKTKDEQLKLKSEKASDKDEKIEKLILDLANTKRKLSQVEQSEKELKEKCLCYEQSTKGELEEAKKIAIEISSQNNELKQENIKLKLENKSINTDNKIVIAHLDKLIREKESTQKPPKEIFYPQERGFIERLYNESVVCNKTINELELFPSERNELSNKVKYEKLTEEFTAFRKETASTMKQLMIKLEDTQVLAEEQENKIKFLEINLSKTNELRDLERESHDKRKKLVTQYEAKIEELTKHNENISDELEKLYGLQKFREKIGHIVTSTRRYNREF